MEKIQFATAKRILKRKTISKQTEDLTEITIKRIEVNNEGVFVSVEEVPYAVKVADGLPKTLMTTIKQKTVEALEDK